MVRGAPSGELEAPFNFSPGLRNAKVAATRRVVNAVAMHTSASGANH